jgi:hypothetical protein
MEFKSFFLISEDIRDLLHLGTKLGKMPIKEIKEIMDGLPDVKKIKWEDRHNSFTLNWETRDQFAHKFSWSIPCKEAIDAIKQFARPPLRDLMAGTGFWAKILNESGLKTIPYDLHISKKYNDYKHSANHMTIKRSNALKTAYNMQRRELSGDVMISWPPYECPIATDVLTLLPIGTRIVYIGESSGGCTGDLSFHSFLHTNCQELISVNLPHFSGIHDYLWIYEKTKNAPIDTAKRGVTMLNTYPD